jgi:hypothetical protein
MPKCSRLRQCMRIILVPTESPPEVCWSGISLVVQSVLIAWRRPSTAWRRWCTGMIQCTHVARPAPVWWQLPLSPTTEPVSASALHSRKPQRCHQISPFTERQTPWIPAPLSPALPIHPPPTLNGPTIATRKPAI